MSGRFVATAVALVLVAAAIGGCHDDDGAGEADLSALTDVPWAVVSGIDVPGWQRVAPTVTFKDGRMSAWGGCNRITAPAEIKGDAMTIDVDRSQTTRKACSAPGDAVERAFLAALRRVATWGVEDGKLTVRSDGGDALLGLSVPTVDGDWTATMINDGSAFSSTLPDVTITASFRDGTVSGSAGCNTYTASYRSQRGSITIDPPKATRKLCSEPDGVMEQEHKYLAALPRAASYSVEGDGLSLFAADGTFVATFRRE